MHKPPQLTPFYEERSSWIFSPSLRQSLATLISGSYRYYSCLMIKCAAGTRTDSFMQHKMDPYYDSCVLSRRNIQKTKSQIFQGGKLSQLLVCFFSKTKFFFLV
ncbi:hypothetical protein ILYODFUR_015096 [Ilyodon furcidens]|uniref:Uncharacterized protein n=1 Tax=Ilyodon furcidens TaxID=33524 RepID=A0ABV0US49_9TELE